MKAHFKQLFPNFLSGFLESCTFACSKLRNASSLVLGISLPSPIDRIWVVHEGIVAGEDPVHQKTRSKENAAGSVEKPEISHAIICSGH